MKNQHFCQSPNFIPFQPIILTVKAKIIIFLGQNLKRALTVHTQPLEGPEGTQGQFYKGVAGSSNNFKFFPVSNLNSCLVIVLQWSPRIRWILGQTSKRNRLIQKPTLFETNRFDQIFRCSQQPGKTFHLIPGPIKNILV